MRQILLNSGGAVVARVARPLVEPGSVLVRVRYSLISVGTEIAPLRSVASQAPDSSAIERGVEYASLAKHYFRASLRDPKKAMDRVSKILKTQAAKLKPARPVPIVPAISGELTWTPANADITLATRDNGVSLVTDTSAAGYQIMSQAVGVPDGQVPVVRLSGRVDEGVIAVGLLNDARDKWIGSRTYHLGPFEDTLIFDPKGSGAVTIVVTTAGAAGRSRVTLADVNIGMAPPTIGGLPLSELDVQGWGVGYSAAGEVVAVGEGVSDLAAGDLVACAGAGQANHADFINVKRNLVVRVPHGCPISLAASTTVGSIAMQGVRRAQPQLGDRV